MHVFINCAIIFVHLDPNHQRQDGCSVMRFEIATGKAFAAIGMGMPSRHLEEGPLKDRSAFLNALAAASGGKFIPVPGGVLIVRDSVIVGSVGISGDTSPNDELCAIAGIAAAGLQSLPKLQPKSRV